MSRFGHLVRRFFGFVSARPPGPADQALLREYLTGEEALLFWAQQYQDQRHALHGAARVSTVRSGDRTAFRAALLHDVGKRHSRLGAVGRSVATVLDTAGIPLSGRLAHYRAHGPLGARELAALGCEPMVVAFAEHHPGSPPEGLDPEQWSALLAADEV